MLCEYCVVVDTRQTCLVRSLFNVMFMFQITRLQEELDAAQIEKMTLVRQKQEVYHYRLCRQTTGILKMKNAYPW